MSISARQKAPVNLRSLSEYERFRHPKVLGKSTEKDAHHIGCMELVPKSTGRQSNQFHEPINARIYCVTAPPRVAIR